MKIEKLSENQVKFTLTQSDLIERNLKITELAHGSEKTQALFREMMEQASAECGFQADNTPLMIEAIPASLDSITIIVTKVQSAEEMEDKFSMLPRSKETGKFVSKDFIDSEEQLTNEDNISVFSFNTLDDVTNLSERLMGSFLGSSSLLKEQNRYFLILQHEPQEDSFSTQDLEAVLSEYGKKHISTVMSKYYLFEHGELIIGNKAISVLANL